MIKDTKEIINLAGQLDWRVRNGKIDGAKETMKQLKIRLNRVDKKLNEIKI